MKKRLILTCERLILVFKVLYLSFYISNEHKTRSFTLNCCEQIWGVERAEFCGQPPATLSLAAPLSTIFQTTTHLCRFHD